MRKVIGNLVVLMIVNLIISSTAQAKIAVHALEVGPTISTITYKEPGYMRESGTMAGIAGSYAYHNNVMFMIEGDFSYGQMKYEGRLTNGTPITINNIDDYLVEVRALGGYDFRLLETMFLTPYVGVGYRFLSDKIGSAFVNGYDRESNYLYLPVGIMFTTELKNNWSLGTTLEYDIFLKGTQKSYLNDVDPGYNILKKQQHNGHGFRGSIKIEKGFFSAELFVKYWDIGASEQVVLTFYDQSVGYRLEPKNNSTQIGMKLCWRFSF